MTGKLTNTLDTESMIKSEVEEGHIAALGSEQY